MVERTTGKDEKNKEHGIAAGQPNFKVAPKKSVAEICQYTEDCVLDASKSNIDFTEYLCDAALNLSDQDVPVAERTAIELFTSDEFRDLVSLINGWKQINAATGKKFADFLLNYEQSARDKAAETLLHVWPYEYLIVETLR